MSRRQAFTKGDGWFDLTYQRSAAGPQWYHVRLRPVGPGETIRTGGQVFRSTSGRWCAFQVPGRLAPENLPAHLRRVEGFATRDDAARYILMLHGYHKNGFDD